jgi:hypothetical protein
MKLFFSRLVVSIYAYLPLLIQFLHEASTRLKDPSEPISSRAVRTFIAAFGVVV